MKESDPDGGPDSPLRSGGNTLAADLARLDAHLGGQPASADWQDPTNRSQTPADRQRGGVPPAAARNLQLAIVQGTMIYASELTWSGRTDVEGEYQMAINRMGRATLDVFRSTPLGIVAAESGLALTRALLDHRQARPTQRLYARPRGGNGLGGWIARRFHLGTNKEVFDRRSTPSTRLCVPSISGRRAATATPLCGFHGRHRQDKDEPHRPRGSPPTAR